MQITPKLTTPPMTGAFAAGTFILCLVFRYGPMPVDTFLLAYSILILSMAPLWDWVRAGEPTIPMFPLVSLSYGINTGFGAISQPSSILVLSVTYPLEWQYMNQALWLSFAGILLMMGAYYLTRRSLQSTRYAVRLYILPERRAGLLAMLVLSALAVNVLFSRGLISWGGHLTIINGFLLLACVLSASFYYRGGTQDPRSRTVMIVLLIYLFMTGVVTGMLETALVPLLAIFIVRSAWLRRFPVRVTLMTFVLFLAFNSTKTDYRNRVWLNQEAQSYADSIRIWVDVVSKFDPKIFLVGDAGADPDPLWRKSLSRMSVINRIAWVCKNTPQRIPYLHGASYLPFLYAPIPRILWHDKPILSEALTDIDATYDLATTNSQGNLTAAVGVSYIGEAFANFGYIGVGVVMLIQGVFLAAFGAIYNRVGSEGGAAIYVAACVYMINGIGSAAINIYGIILQMIACSTLVLLPFATGVSPGMLPPPPTQALRRMRVTGATMGGKPGRLNDNEQPIHPAG